MSAAPGLFLEAADRIARRLCRDALWADGRCNWMGWNTVPIGATWVTAWKAQGWTLYDGVAGVALFLTEAVRLTGDAVERATLTGALRQLDRATAGADPAAAQSGYYCGLAGAASVYRLAGTVLGDEHWTERALATYEALSQHPPDPARLDVMAGSAGVIAPLVDAALRFQRDRFLEAAERHGRALIASARRSGDGWSWETSAGTAVDHLLGFAHGAGGIATALFELHAATGAGAYREAAEEAIRYERSRFSPVHRNWPDFRRLPAINGQPGSTEPRYSVAWCHGAPGVGMARLSSWASQHDEATTAELSTALETTLSTLPYVTAPGSGNFSLCHGAAGNADFLLLASELLNRPDLAQAAASIGELACAHYHHADLPWPCGTPGGGESPGLLLGIAGIGHFLLRLHAPGLVRSALTLPSTAQIRREEDAPMHAPASV